MGGYRWEVYVVEPCDPILVDRTGNLTVAVTDPESMAVYVSSALSGSFLTRVMIHELAHCAIFSYDLLPDIHRMCHPEYWVEAEEWVCNFLADYGRRVFDTAYRVVGDRALELIPGELDRLVA